MNNMFVILMVGLLLVPLITNMTFTNAVVGGPYTDKVSAELGSSDRFSGNGFSPNEVIVSAGTTVVWTNKDTVGHTIVSGRQGNSDAGGLFDTGPRWAPGAHFEHTFDTVGEFPYFCEIYPWMTGKVIVAEVVIQEDVIGDVPIDIPIEEIREEDIIDANGGGVRDFIVEDPNGDRMSIRPTSTNHEAFDALTEMAKTGEIKWVGGEIHNSTGSFGFRFKPNTLVVSETTTEGAQASKYESIQSDLAHWQELGAVYISGKVISVRDKVTVNHQQSSFNVTTVMTNGGVNSIEIDQDSASVLVKLDASVAKVGNLTITLPRELIDSRTDTADKKFIVKVDNDIVKHKEPKLEKTADTHRKLRIALPAGAAEVEIIGTQVVPEFPFGLAVMLAGLVSVIVVMTRLNVVNKILNV